MISKLKKTAKLVLALSFFVAVSVLLYTAYKNHTSPPPNPYENLTLMNVVNQCEEPVMVFPTTAFNMPIQGMLGRHSDCLGVKDLILVIWSGEDSERNRTAAKLITLMLTDFESSKLDGVTLIPKMIKVMPVDLQEGDNRHVVFYSVQTVKDDAVKEK